MNAHGYFVAIIWGVIRPCATDALSMLHKARWQIDSYRRFDSDRHTTSVCGAGASAWDCVVFLPTPYTVAGRPPRRSLPGLRRDRSCAIVALSL